MSKKNKPKRSKKSKGQASKAEARALEQPQSLSAASNRTTQAADNAQDQSGHADAQPYSLALNLADIGHAKNLMGSSYEELYAHIAYLCDDVALRFSRNSIDRIYVGSYFCDRFFLSIDDGFLEGVSYFCRTTDLALTLVVPVFGQSTLAAGRARAAEMLAMRDDAGTLFDEVVVNDPAMAHFFHEITAGASGETAPMQRISICIGRMMAKSPRDPRHEVLSAAPQPYALDAGHAQALASRFGCSLLECDPTAPFVDARPLQDAIPLALHLPHCFMTTGHICQAASTFSPVERKFRADMPCAQECLAQVQVYEHHNYDTAEPLWFTRQGRTIYFENPGCELIGTMPQRIIWTPADFICSAQGVHYDAYGQQGGAQWE